MYAAKAASGGGPAGQVQGQPGVPSSGQGVYGFLKISQSSFILLYEFSHTLYFQDNTQVVQWQEVQQGWPHHHNTRCQSQVSHRLTCMACK